MLHTDGKLTLCIFTGGLQSASSAASAFSAMSTTAKDVVDQASANGGPGGTGSGGKDTDDNGEYTLTDGFKDVCGIASRSAFPSIHSARISTA